MSELDRLKEEISFLKFWLGIAVVIVMSLTGWLLSEPDNTQSLAFGLAVAGVILAGIVTLIVYRQIGRRIDRIGEL